MAEPVLYVIPEYPEEEHVAAEVEKPPVDEHGGKQGQRKRDERPGAYIDKVRDLVGYRRGPVYEQLAPCAPKGDLIGEDGYIQAYYQDCHEREG